MKKHRNGKRFLDELRKVPIVQVACEKAGVSRNSVYRWRREDEEFATAMDEAMDEGVSFVSDMSESQLLTPIREKHFPSLRFWLNKRSPKYQDKVEITTRSKPGDDILTPEQEEIVRRALLLSTQKQHEKPNE